MNEKHYMIQAKGRVDVAHKGVGAGQKLYLGHTNQIGSYDVWTADRKTGVIYEDLDEAKRHFKDAQVKHILTEEVEPGSLRLVEVRTVIEEVAELASA